MNLKPCPFCGTEAVISTFVVGCPECATSFTYVPDDKEDKNKAINQWNTRNGK
jgi:Lar family restriction alleviation protein